MMILLATSSPTICLSLCFISPAALLVKVLTSSFEGGMP